MKNLFNLPNVLTLCNLICGCLGIVLLFDCNLEYDGNTRFLVVFGLMLLAAIFDFFDGFFARKFGVAGPLGVQLDSLADMITSGLVPGFVMYRLMYVMLVVSLPFICLAVTGSSFLLFTFYPRRRRSIYFLFAIIYLLFVYRPFFFSIFIFRYFLFTSSSDSLSYTQSSPPHQA